MVRQEKTRPAATRGSGDSWDEQGELPAAQPRDRRKEKTDAKAHTGKVLRRGRGTPEALQEKLMPYYGRQRKKPPGVVATKRQHSRGKRPHGWE